MISFIWSSTYPFMAGTGGSENYTVGQIRELQRRGIPCRIVTLRHGENDGRHEFPDIEFLAIKRPQQIASLEGTVVFITKPLEVHTKQQSYVILHCPPPAGKELAAFRRAMSGKQGIAVSNFSARIWARKLRCSLSDIPVAYPFAGPEFGKVEHTPDHNRAARVLFAGRLTPDKGIYTLLCALHDHNMRKQPIEFLATNAGAHTPDGEIVHALLQAHPAIKVIPARKTPQSMAELLASVDVVVMPSHSLLWPEPFGILSVEAQHAGARVIASNAGGLPETACGGLTLVEPENAVELAKAVIMAIKLKRLTRASRRSAARHFTVKQSVDALLEIVSLSRQAS